MGVTFPCSYFLVFSSIGLDSQWGENGLNISILPKNTMILISQVMVLETETKDLDIHLYALKTFRPNLQWP